MISQKISHYLILEKLGSGGMSDVYLAEDVKLRRKVAIKFLTPERMADPHARRRLLREAQAAAALDHPNICAILEVGDDGPNSFIVMQYVEGETLAHRIGRGRLEVDEAVDIATQTARALQDAHSQGIIHRDIKPENIMLTPRGQVKVLDFGLAKVAGEVANFGSDAPTQSLLSQPGTIIGTIPYMSPEQLRAEEIDARSDIFSFGAVLYEMLYGQRPFLGGNGAETIAAILMREPPPLSLRRDDVPPELERILRNCLAKERENRYATSQDLLLDLEDFQRVGASGALEQGRTPEARRRPGSRLPALVALGVAALFTLAGVGAYLFVADDPATAGPSSADSRDYLAGIDSIAVMPFNNAGADSDTEYLSDGITESLISNLSEVPNLRVIARSSVFQYKGRDDDAKAIGDKLKVQALVTGRILQRGDLLSVRVELVNTKDDSRIWGSQFDRRLSDILSVQEQISREITDRLRLKLSNQEKQRLSKQPTDNFEAYQLYVNGRYFWNKRTVQGIKKGAEYFQQAIDKDPSFALAYAGLADSYALLTFYGDAQPAEAFPKARAAAQEALRLDENLAEAHTTLASIAFWHDWNWKGAEEEYRRAIELKPNYATAHHWYSLFLIANGRLNEAIAEGKRAQDLDPLSVVINMHLGRAFFYAGEEDLAIEQSQKTLEMNPNFALAHLLLGLSYEQKGMYTEAIAAIQKASTVSGDKGLTAGALGQAYALSGRTKEARKILRELQVKSRHRNDVAFDVALVHTGLGEKDEAFRWLQRAYEEHSWGLIYLKTEPLLKSLRPDPRFKELLQRMGLDS